MEDKDFKAILTQACEWEETSKGISSWIFDKKGDAVRVANYLRGYEFKVELKCYSSFLQRIGWGYLVMVQ